MNNLRKTTSANRTFEKTALTKNIAVKNGRVAIAGAGIAGRLLAWQLAEQGFDITLYDQNASEHNNSCSFVAGGILSPLAELETTSLQHAEHNIYQLGMRSIALWKNWCEQGDLPAVFFENKGSFIIAHNSDAPDLSHYYETLSHYSSHNEQFAWQEASHAPFSHSGLSHFGRAIFLKPEAQIDTSAVMQCLHAKLTQHQRVHWRHEAHVEHLDYGELRVSESKSKTGDDTPQSTTETGFDWVFDCRGLGAKQTIAQHVGDNSGLRGVRGELLLLHAPDVKITHLTRLIHPRYRLYIVPRPNHHYLIGATEIETEDYSPISVRSSLELMSAAYSVDKGFGEARVIASKTHCRPAAFDNLPVFHCAKRDPEHEKEHEHEQGSTEVSKGLGIINGLYRHGYLLAPALVERMVNTVMRLESPPIKPRNEPKSVS